MKQQEKYDPEDIESLLLNKQFYELYPEERAFVLKHLEDESEYNRLRRLLLEIHEIAASDDLLTPDSSIKRHLMNEIKKEKKGKFTIWLNSLFASPELPWWKQRGMQLSLGVMLILIAVGAFSLLYQNEPLSLATLAPHENELLKTPLDSSMSKSIDQSESSAVQELEIDETPVVIAPRPKKLEIIKQVTVEAIENDAPLNSASAEGNDSPALVESISDEQVNENVDLKNNSFTTTLSSVESTAIKSESAKEKKISTRNESISLSQHSDLIDLLFTAR